MANIELVIKIPEEEYRWIIKSDEIVFADVASKECMLHAIKSGTPLPKGHGNLIDRDALEYEIASIEGYSEYDYECVAREDIEQAPIIIKADTEEKEI